MSIKFTAPNSQFLRVMGAAALNLPNSDWTIAIAITFNGWMVNGTGQYAFSGGAYGAADALSLCYQPSASDTMQLFFEGNGPILPLNFPEIANGTYIAAVQRSAGVVRLKMCPAQSSMPTSGSAVLTSAASMSLTRALAMPGHSGGLVLGNRSNDRTIDQSLSRALCVHEALSDLDIAKLAHGMQITDLGKTPVWHIRMNDGSDTADLGATAMSVVRSSGADPMPTGAAPGWAYVTSNRPPTVAKPTIDGTPQVGTASTATLGTVDAAPAPTLTYQWLVDGVNGAGAGATTASYTPASADVGKALTVRVNATNSEGSGNATSDAKTVAAAVTAVTVVSPDNERIFQRIGTSSPVALSGTCTGEAPVSLQYRLMSRDGLTEIKTWADIGATFPAGGSWAATPAIPQGAQKYRIQVRSLRSNGTTIATSDLAANAFGVGDLIGMIGSSSANSWSYSSSTGTFDDARASMYSGGAWNVGSRTYASVMATYIAQQLGVVIGTIAAGVGGTSIVDWARTNRLNCFSGFTDIITALGGKLAGVFTSVGSNDAAYGGSVTSKAAHLENLNLLFSKIRTHTAQPNLPMLIGGYNRRTSFGGPMDQAQFDVQSNWVREAEKDAADQAGANLYHVQVLDYELTDGIHLSSYAGMCGRMGYVWSEAMQGRRRQGPRITAFSFSGTDLYVDVEHGNGTDIAPSTGGSGLTLTDASGTPTLVSTARVSATRYRATFDRALVAPVAAKFLAGSAPTMAAPIYDNGAVPLPMMVETEMAATLAEATPAPDATAPVMTGSVTVASITTSGAALSWPAATDVVGVAGYEYSIDGGANYSNVGNARTVTVSGRAASTEHQVRVRAYDAAGNRATPLSTSFTTLAEQPTTPGAVSASTVAESRRVAFPGGTRVVAFGTVPSAAVPNAPYLEAGRWWCEKHPLDERYWVADITVDLAERGTTAATVEAIVAGVTVLQDPVIQGKLIPVKLGGFNAATGAVNFCTFRVRCADGQRFDRTIWFKQQVGSWSLNKDADDESYFVADIGNDLADSNTTAAQVKAFPVGVVELVPAAIQGPLILVKLGGMDTLPAGVNYCDLRIDCANSERFYRTIQFNRMDN